MWLINRGRIRTSSRKIKFSFLRKYRASGAKSIWRVHLKYGWKCHINLLTPPLRKPDYPCNWCNHSRNQYVNPQKTKNKSIISPFLHMAYAQRTQHHIPQMLVWPSSLLPYSQLPEKKITQMPFSRCMTTKMGYTSTTGCYSTAEKMWITPLGFDLKASFLQLGLLREGRN